MGSLSVSGRVIALSGGVGGAKLALGLARVLPAEDLLVVANTGDDFEHLGYHVCPDIDTLLYTLAGINNPETGWGRADETWTFMEKLRQDRPSDAWFLLGDKDLETHRLRREGLRSGKSLSTVTTELARHFGLPDVIVPMTDDPVHTRVQVERPGGALEWLAFQDYFVRHRCEPVVRAIEFSGVERACMASRLTAALAGRPRAIVLCPSNPFLSIDPILALPGLRDALRAARAPVIAVSPVVAGKAIKGPTAKLMQELGLDVSAVSVARHYQGLVDGLVLDSQDRSLASAAETFGMQTRVVPTVMRSTADRIGLARDVLAFADRQ